MRKLPWPLLLLCAGLAAAGPVQLQTAVRFEFIDCASGGSVAQTITDGTYLLRVTDENAWLCYAGTCTGTSGEKYPVGTVMLIKLCSNKFCDGSGTSSSCRSAGSSGDVILTRADGS